MNSLATEVFASHGSAAAGNKGGGDVVVHVTSPPPPRDHAEPKNVYRIVDLFAGPGGLDVAARDLGIPADGIEWDPGACATRLAAGLSTRQGDVRDFGPADFPDANVLAGGPPCQTYTVAGSGAGRRALDDVLTLAKSMATGETRTTKLGQSLDLRTGDERTGLVLEPLRWAIDAIEARRPYEAIVLEQVPAVLPVWMAVAEALDGEGYDVDCKILKTEMYGVPQTRRRAVLIARRSAKVKFPEPTHQEYRKGVPPVDGSGGVLPWVSMESVLDRPRPFVVVSNYGTGGDPKARGRRHSNEPAATVTGKISRNRILTPGRDDDRFTFAEAGLLQSFPRDHPWRGKDIAQQIGNAIPPRLARHVLAAALGLDPYTGAVLPTSAEALTQQTRLTSLVLPEAGHALLT